jgi:hypothetical protein
MRHRIEAAILQAVEEIASQLTEIEDATHRRAVALRILKASAR